MYGIFRHQTKTAGQAGAAAAVMISRPDLVGMVTRWKLRLIDLYLRVSLPIVGGLASVGMHGGKHEDHAQNKTSHEATKQHTSLLGEQNSPRTTQFLQCRVNRRNLT